MVEFNKQFFEKEIQKLDKNLSNEKEHKVFLTAEILLASGFFGPNEKQIAKALELTSVEDLAILKKAKRNLIKNNIWLKGKVAGSEWLDKKTGAIAFWLDVSVALGLLKKTFKKNKVI